MLRHPFDPVWNADSKILIVGSMPSVISREYGFYYGNPRNRFYKILSELLNAPYPYSIPDKKAMLLNSGIAVYDVLKECDIKGSADSTVKNAVPNDFEPIFRGASIKRVFANGRTAYNYYSKLVGECVYLPSTSPANAAWGDSRLKEVWSVILDYLDIG